MLFLTSCWTWNVLDGDNVHPQLNNDSFTNYTPWWVTNNIPTNAVSKGE